MKLSVSLPDADVAVLDRVVAERRSTRSAVLREAVGLLQEQMLRAEYESAADEWEAPGEAEAWGPTDGDGMSDRW